MVITSAVVMRCAYCKKSFQIFPTCSSHWLKCTLYKYFLQLWFINQLLFLSDDSKAVFLIRCTVMSASYHGNDIARQFPSMNLHHPSCHYSTLCRSGEWDETKCFYPILTHCNTKRTTLPSLTQYAFISTASYLISQISETIHGQKVEHHYQAELTG